MKRALNNGKRNIVISYICVCVQEQNHRLCKIINVYTRNTWYFFLFIWNNKAFNDKNSYNTLIKLISNADVID